MAVVETIIATVGGVATAALTVFGGYWMANRKHSQGRTKEDILAHSIFSTLYSWKVEKIQSLSIKHKVKDEIMQLYAMTVLSTYLDGLQSFTSTLSKDNIVPMTKLYLGRVQDTHDALYRSNIPEVFIQRIYEYTSALRESTFLEIERIEQSESPYFSKVYDTLGEILFFIQTMVKGIPQVTSRLNGEFEAAIQDWKKK